MIKAEETALLTRMHSSRMRTIRCSSYLPGWGGSSQGGVCPRRCLPCRVCPRGRCLSRGGVCQWVLSMSMGGLADIPPPPPSWTEFLTHACGNITLKYHFSDFLRGGRISLPFVSEKCWPGLGDGGGPYSHSLLPSF